MSYKTKCLWSQARLIWEIYFCIDLIPLGIGHTVPRIREKAQEYIIASKVETTQFCSLSTVNTHTKGYFPY